MEYDDIYSMPRNKRRALKRFSTQYGIPHETGQDQMDALIQMNDLQNLIKDFESPESAVSGLETWRGGSAGKDTAEKLFSILQNQQPWEDKGTPSPFDITNIVGNIAEGKAYKDKQPPQIGVGGIGGSMQREPEKMQGIMALLQRLLPGGKTGYR